MNQLSQTSSQNPSHGVGTLASQLLVRDLLPVRSLFISALLLWKYQPHTNHLPFSGFSLLTNASRMATSVWCINQRSRACLFTISHAQCLEGLTTLTLKPPEALLRSSCTCLPLEHLQQSQAQSSDRWSLTALPWTWKFTQGLRFLSYQSKHSSYFSHTCSPVELGWC